MNQRGLTLVFGFVAVVLFSGALRYSAYSPSILSPFSGYATLLYIVATIFFTVALVRVGIGLNRIGFGFRLSLTHVALALIGAVLIQISSPIWETLLGAGRELDRFESIQGSLGLLLATLALSWTFAAFGEEIAFRILMMRGLAVAMGDHRVAKVVALLTQAMVFGLVHWYQGPTGVVGSMANGLIFGALTIIAKGAIWPAALAHGISNTIGLVVLYLGE